MSELAQARDLLGGGDTAAALKLLERARRRALSRQDQSGLRDVVALAGPIAGSGAEGKQQRAAGRIVYAAEQNLRFLERGSALGQAVEEAGPPTVGSLVAALLVHVLVGGTWLFVAVIAVGLGDPGRFGNGPTHADYIRALTVAGALWWAAALVMVWRWWKGRQPLFVSMIWFFVAIGSADRTGRLTRRQPTAFVRGCTRRVGPLEGGRAVQSDFRVDRRDFLKKTATLLAGAAAFPLVAPRGARAGGIAKGEFGLVGADHVGLTVPDIEEAVAWFRNVMGAVAPLSFGPIADPQGTLMQDLLGVDPRAVIDQITVLRIGHSANIELFQYEAPDQLRTHPRNSDWSGHHIAFYVTDIDAAVAYMESKGVQKFLGPFPLTAGPAAGQTINYFKTPFGTYVELISYPKGMAYQVPSVKPLWSPKQNGFESEVTTVPGLLGIDHVGITVPDVAAAAAWFEDVLGGINPLTFGPFSDPTGDFMQQLVDVDPRAIVDQIRMVRAGNGPGVELFQYEAPDQDHTFRKNSDWGGHHVAFYVRHIDKAVEYLQSKGAQKRLGPFAVTAGPAAGQTINYFRTPFGTDIELISYPHGMAYEATAPIPLWDPRNNHP